MALDSLDVGGIKSVVPTVLVVGYEVMVADNLPESLRADPQLLRERWCGLQTLVHDADTTPGESQPGRAAALGQSAPITEFVRSWR